MKRLITLLGFLSLVSCHAMAIPDKDCVLQNIPVVSSDLLRNEVYVARKKAIEVHFRNENAPKPAEIFPDPLVTVRHLNTAKSCDIADGDGIWSGKSVYLDANEHILILNEYSGANDTLVFYDTRNCHRLDELDVSGKRWQISGDRIRTGQHCEGDAVTSCRSIQELKLDRHCLAKTAKSFVRK